VGVIASTHCCLAGGDGLERVHFLSRGGTVAELKRDPNQTARCQGFIIYLKVRGKKERNRNLAEHNQATKTPA